MSANRMCDRCKKTIPPNTQYWAISDHETRSNGGWSCTEEDCFDICTDCLKEGWLNPPSASPASAASPGQP